MIFVLSNVVRYARDEDRLKAYIRNGNWDNVVCLDPVSELSPDLKWVELHYPPFMPLQSGKAFYILICNDGKAYYCNDIFKHESVEQAWKDRDILNIIDIENPDKPLEMVSSWNEWSLIKEL